jgi:hypothetical protein
MYRERGRPFGSSLPVQSSPTPKQPFQRLETDTPASVLHVRECLDSNCELAKWWQLLVNEPLEPPQRGAFVPLRIETRQELAERERILERQSRPSPAQPSLPRSDAGAGSRARNGLVQCPGWSSWMAAGATAPPQP